jgi:MFS family permease
VSTFAVLVLTILALAFGFCAAAYGGASEKFPAGSGPKRVAIWTLIWSVFVSIICAFAAGYIAGQS